MEAHDEELIQTLAAKDSKLKLAYDEHQRLNVLVDEFGAKGKVSADDERERKRLQKLKLVEKDKIMRILGEHRGLSN